MGTEPSGQSLFEKSDFGNSSPKSCIKGYQTFPFLSSITGFLYSVPNILSGIVWARTFLVLTRPSLLQTSIFWHFCIIGLGQKFDFRKLSTLLIGIFLIELVFLSHMSTFSRNFAHHWKCREQKENFQTIVVIIFWNFTIFYNILQYFTILYNILVHVRFTTIKRKFISSIANLVYELPQTCIPNDWWLRILGN